MALSRCSLADASTNNILFVDHSQVQRVVHIHCNITKVKAELIKGTFGSVMFCELGDSDTRAAWA